jgi:hypothetical protein
MLPRMGKWPAVATWAVAATDPARQENRTERQRANE